MTDTENQPVVHITAETDFPVPNGTTEEEAIQYAERALAHWIEADEMSVALDFREPPPGESMSQQEAENDPDIDFYCETCGQGFPAAEMDGDAYGVICPHDGTVWVVKV